MATLERGALTHWVWATLIIAGEWKILDSLQYIKHLFLSLCQKEIIYLNKIFVQLLFVLANQQSTIILTGDYFKKKKTHSFASQPMCFFPYYSFLSLVLWHKGGEMQFINVKPPFLHIVYSTHTFKPLGPSVFMMWPCNVLCDHLSIPNFQRRQYGILRLPRHTCWASQGPGDLCSQQHCQLLAHWYPPTLMKLEAFVVAKVENVFGWTYRVSDS